MSVVYFIQVQPHGPIKIGTTGGNVVLRMRALQQTSPHVLKWIGWFAGNRKDEQAAHRLLQNYRVRGEWFYPTREVLDFINEKSPDFDQAKFETSVFMDAERQIVRKVLPPWTRENPHRQTIIAASGMDTYSFHKWMDGTRAADPEKARRAAECALQLIAPSEPERAQAS